MAYGGKKRLRDSDVDDPDYCVESDSSYCSSRNSNNIVIKKCKVDRAEKDGVDDMDIAQALKDKENDSGYDTELEGEREDYDMHGFFGDEDAEKGVRRGRPKDDSKNSEKGFLSSLDPVEKFELMAILKPNLHSADHMYDYARAFVHSMSDRQRRASLSGLPLFQLFGISRLARMYTEAKLISNGVVMQNILAGDPQFFAPILMTTSKDPTETYVGLMRDRFEREHHRVYVLLATVVSDWQVNPALDTILGTMYNTDIYKIPKFIRKTYMEGMEVLNKKRGLNGGHSSYAHYSCRQWDRYYSLLRRREAKKQFQQARLHYERILAEETLLYTKENESDLSTRHDDRPGTPPVEVPAEFVGGPAPADAELVNAHMSALSNPSSTLPIKSRILGKECEAKNISGGQALQSAVANTTTCEAIPVRTLSAAEWEYFQKPGDPTEELYKRKKNSHMTMKTRSMQHGMTKESISGGQILQDKVVPKACEPKAVREQYCGGWYFCEPPKDKDPRTSTVDPAVVQDKENENVN